MLKCVHSTCVQSFDETTQRHVIPALELRPNEVSDEINDGDDVEAVHHKGCGLNPHSGQPLTLHETVLELPQAGFHPLKHDHLFRGLENIVYLFQTPHYLISFTAIIMSDRSRLRFDTLLKSLDNTSCAGRKQKQTLVFLHLIDTANE